MLHRGACAARLRHATSVGTMTPMILSRPERIADCMKRGWWGRRTVDQVFREAVAASGDAPALVDPPNREALVGSPPRRLTFSQLDTEVDRLAELLHALGCRKDDVVAVQLPNIAEAAVVFLACARLGLVFCPIAIQFRAHELSYLLAKSGARVAITVERVREAPFVERFLELRRSIPSLKHVLVVGGDPAIGFVPSGADAPPSAPTMLRDYLSALTIDANDTLTLCWTSGTEARPKGVPRHHNHWIANGEACSEIGRVGPGEAILNPFPMINTASIGGMVMPWLMSRARLVQHHPFDLGVFLAQVANERIVYTVAPPAILSQLLKNEDVLKSFDISALRVLGSGSAPLAPWMVEGWQTRLGISIVNIFGSNEGCALFGTGEDLPDPHARAQVFPRFGVPGLEWATRYARKVRTRLVDLETGEEITTVGRPGELRVDGAMRFDGYWDEPELSRASFDEEGYFRSGDLFELAGEGATPPYYRFIGRAKDIIIRGGMKISPAELDAMVEGHPGIREAAFCAVPDPILGERVGLVAVPKPGQTVTLESVIEFLRALDVATFKLPEKLSIAAELPRNSLGKVLRRDLPALFAAG
jgi:acyl-CoA synthetase (AMP-forming)/AMP-acid ligase II